MSNTENRSNSDSDDDLRRRLAKARAREDQRAGRGPRKGLSREMASGWGAIALRAGIEMISAVLVAGAIGFGLDRWAGTLPLFLIVLVLMGIAAGILNVWRAINHREARVGFGPSPRDQAADDSAAPATTDTSERRER